MANQDMQNEMNPQSVYKRDLLDAFQTSLRKRRGDIHAIFSARIFIRRLVKSIPRGTSTPSASVPSIASRGPLP